MAEVFAAAGLPAELCELARRRDHGALRQHLDALRGSSDWTAPQALRQACLWLLAGDARQADHLILEADRLDPALALIPDIWGLWPPPPLPAQRGDEAKHCQQLLALYRRWRQPDLIQLWPALLQQLQADWQQAIEPEQCGDAMLLFGYALQFSGSEGLSPPLDSSLAALVDEAAMADQPAAACRFWLLMASIRPEWDLAVIRAADLSLERGEVERCQFWLDQAPASTHLNPWYHDVLARCCLDRGDAEAALTAWAEAIRQAQARPEQQRLVETFQGRRREARRGPAVLQVRQWISRGEQQRAAQLLEALLADDPQWQPLIDLRESLLIPAPLIEGDSAPNVTVLDRAEKRLAAWGVSVKPRLQSPLSDDAMIEELAQSSRRLSDLEARFALA